MRLAGSPEDLADGALLSGVLSPNRTRPYCAVLLAHQRFIDLADPLTGSGLVARPATL